MKKIAIIFALACMSTQARASELLLDCLAYRYDPINSYVGEWSIAVDLTTGRAQISNEMGYTPLSANSDANTIYLYNNPLAARIDRVTGNGQLIKCRVCTVHSVLPSR
jgi:hypothetical protein